MSHYADMLHLDRPASAHPKMHREDRAKLFAPFAALSGHDAAIHQQEKVLVPKVLLAGYALDCLDRKLRMLQKGDMVTVTYFVPLKRTMEETLGEYVTVTDTVVKLDLYDRVLYLKDQAVPVDDLARIRSDSPD